MRPGDLNTLGLHLSVQAASDGSGMGSTFIVHLPAIPAPNANSCEQISVIPAECKPRRVLVVEDNDDIRETLGILLTQDGHEVHLANDGPSGLKAALTFRPDIGLSIWDCQDLTAMRWRAAFALTMRARKSTSWH